MTVRFGFMETPNIPKALALARKLGWKFDIMSTSFFLSRRSLKPSAQGGHAAAGWTGCLSRLARTPNDATDYLPHSHRPRGGDRHAGDDLNLGTFVGWGLRSRDLRLTTGGVAIIGGGGRGGTAGGRAPLFRDLPFKDLRGNPRSFFEAVCMTTAIGALLRAVGHAPADLFPWALQRGARGGLFGLGDWFM